MCSLHSLSIGYYGVGVHTGTLTHTRTHTLTHTQSTGLSMSHVLVYVYYFGLMNHSGMKMTSWFPWQPDTMFHDNHHKLQT